MPGFNGWQRKARTWYTTTQSDIAAEAAAAVQQQLGRLLLLLLTCAPPLGEGRPGPAQHPGLSARSAGTAQCWSVTSCCLSTLNVAPVLIVGRNHVCSAAL